MDQPTRPARRISPATIALALAAVVALVAIIVALNRRDDAPVAAANQAAPAAAPSAVGAGREQEARERIAVLRRQLAGDPDNAENWFELGSLYLEFEQMQDAEQALRRAMQLQPTNPDYLAATAQAVLLVGADGWEREAQALLRRALAIRPDHAQTRFLLATMKEKAGDHRGAVDDLVALLRTAPPGASWTGHVRRVLNEIAGENRIDLAGRLPAASGDSATAGIPGPTREQMEAARGIPPSQQDEMVDRMVSGLAARLQQNPRDEEGWMRLMRSYKVLNRAADASAALRSALAAFADDAAAQQRLRAAAAALGVAES